MLHTTDVPESIVILNHNMPPPLFLSFSHLFTFDYPAIPNIATKNRGYFRGLPHFQTWMPAGRGETAIP